MRDDSVRPATAPESEQDPGRIEVHIEELVLHGVAPAERHAVADALQRRLESLVARHGVSALLSRQETTALQSAGPITLAPGARPQQMGAQIAETVHRGWR
jgi:hypothetical protein